MTTTYKITDAVCTYARISKDITLENEAGEEIVFNKWYIDSDDGEYDNGYEIVDGETAFNKLDETEQDEITDLIAEYKI
jgi:hypothetical protein